MCNKSIGNSILYFLPTKNKGIDLLLLHFIYKISQNALNLELQKGIYRLVSQLPKRDIVSTNPKYF